MIVRSNGLTAENDPCRQLKFYKHLNVGKIAVMGQSCGGVQGDQVGYVTSRVTTTP